MNNNHNQEILNRQLYDYLNYGSIEGVKTALNAGADPDYTDNIDIRITPLIWSAKNGDIEVIKLLIGKGANVNYVDVYGNTPLIYTTRYGDIETLELFIKNGAKVNHADKYGNTPLIYAARNNDMETIKLLIEADADVNHVNKEGYTPLYFATYHTISDEDMTFLPNFIDSDVLKSMRIQKLLQTVKLLIDHGAETIGIEVSNPKINTLIQAKATELRADLRALSALPNDISALNDTQKTILLKLTAPYKAGNPLIPREDLGGKSLFDFLQKNKSQLLTFTQGYHGDKFLGGADKKLSVVEQRNNLFASIINNPVNYKEDYLGGFQLKQHHLKQHHCATKIQALGRGYISRRNNIDSQIPRNANTRIGNK